MTRDEAIARLRLLEGKDLRNLADTYEITVWKSGKINKGWAGHTLERHLGLSTNSHQRPDFDWGELKIVPLKQAGPSDMRVKETMAITMIAAENVASTPFEDSHLFAKLSRLLVCARLFESQAEEQSKLIRVATFDMSDPGLLLQVKKDYEDVQRVIRENGFQALSGSMGVLVQPRTKGPGHGSTSRAFYARTAFVTKILGL